MESLGDCDLVIESATENEEVKRKIFSDLCPVLKPETIIGTNTSSISITRLAAATDRPEKFIGIHFMNPVPVMELVELIRGIATNDQTFEACRELIKTLQEMRRLLGVLRGEDGERAHLPAPGLGDLPTLVEQVRATGLPVELTVDGQRAEVPLGVDLSAYRVVQEGLTNVLKHAGMASAAVHVRYQPGEIVVEVSDDGRGAATPARENGGGHGLVGMRERVAMCGGELHSGPRPGGGYRISARLPVAGSA